MMSIYYSPQTGETVEGTLASGTATSIVKYGVYRSAGFIWEADVWMKILCVSILGGALLAISRKLGRKIPR